MREWMEANDREVARDRGFSQLEGELAQMRKQAMASRSPQSWVREIEEADRLVQQCRLRDSSAVESVAGSAVGSPQGSPVLGPSALPHQSRFDEPSTLHRRRQEDPDREDTRDAVLAEAEQEMSQVRKHALETIGTQGGRTRDDIHEAERLLDAIRHRRSRNGSVEGSEAGSIGSLRAEAGSVRAPPFPQEHAGSARRSPVMRPAVTPTDFLLDRSTQAYPRNVGSRRRASVPEEVEEQDEEERQRQGQRVGLGGEARLGLLDARRGEESLYDPGLKRMGKGKGKEAVRE